MAQSMADLAQSVGVVQWAWVSGVIVSTSSSSKWPVTSVLGLRREETRINCGFFRKKTSCTMENSGVRRKRKLYGGCNA